MTVQLEQRPTTPAPAAPRVRRGRRADVTAAAAAAVVVLHVLVDAFVTVEPGVDRADHLVPALVPVALVAAGALLWPRLRAGARAAAALALGALALAGASTALADAATGGPAGDDWTGLLLLPAGLALVTVAAHELWRTRKPGGRRVLRRGLIAAAGLVAAFVLVLPVAFAIIATERPRDEAGALDLGAPYQPVALQTADGLRLAASYVPSTNGAAVIAFPARTETAAHVRLLVEHGYGVLALDMRGYGDSAGDPNAFGWGAARDIDAAVAYLQQRPDVRGGRIGGLGLSVGGEQLLEAAAGNPGLRAVVSDGAGERSVRESLLRGPSGWLVVPRDAVLTAAVAVLSGERPPASLEALVPRIAPRPVLLIQAERGAGGEELNAQYARAGGPSTTHWVVPGAAHTGGVRARPAEYAARVLGFLDDALLRAER